MSHATPIGRTRLPRAQRRAQLLTAAARVFVGGGYDGTSMDQVADAAGVTRLILYRNFASKADLYRSVLDLVIDDLRSRFATGGEPLPPPAIPRAVLSTARAHPDAFRLLWRHAVHEPQVAEHAAEFRALVTTFAGTLLDGRVDDTALRRWSAETLAAHVFDGICVWLDTGDPSRDDEFADRMSAGLRALVSAWS